MKETVFSGKTLEEVKDEALKSLGFSESYVYFYVFLLHLFVYIKCFTYTLNLK